MKFLKATEATIWNASRISFLSVQCLCPDAQERADGGTRHCLVMYSFTGTLWLFSYVQTQESKDRQTGNFLWGKPKPLHTLSFLPRSLSLSSGPVIWLYLYKMMHVFCFGRSSSLQSCKILTGFFLSFKSLVHNRWIGLPTSLWSWVKYISAV